MNTIRHAVRFKISLDLPQTVWPAVDTNRLEMYPTVCFIQMRTILVNDFVRYTAKQLVQLSNVGDLFYSRICSNRRDFLDLGALWDRSAVGVPFCPESTSTVRRMPVHGAPSWHPGSCETSLACTYIYSCRSYWFFHIEFPVSLSSTGKFLFDQ